MKISSPKYWIAFSLIIVGSVFVWESARSVIHKTMPFLGAFSDYRFYLGLIVFVVGTLLHSSWLKSRN
jgi:hypothetical protein